MTILDELEQRLKERLKKLRQLRSMPNPLVLNIQYHSRDGGRPTERTIIVLKVFEDELNKEIYIDAFCALREEERQFRLDRIAAFYNDDWSGELDYNKTASKIIAMSVDK